MKASQGVIRDDLFKNTKNFFAETLKNRITIYNTPIRISTLSPDVYWPVCIKNKS